MNKLIFYEQLPVQFDQLQDENLAPFWGGSGKPAPKKGSAEFLKKEGEGRRQETQIWHRR